MPAGSLYLRDAAVGTALPGMETTQPLGVGGDRLFTWFSDGDTPSRYHPGFKMSAVSAPFFDEGVGRVGAVISGRRTYDISEAWGGSGPMPGVPLFVLTHRVPDTVSTGDPPYTFATDGVERAVEQARTAAAGKDVALTGATIVQQCLRAGPARRAGYQEHIPKLNATRAHITPAPTVAPEEQEGRSVSASRSR